MSDIEAAFKEYFEIVTFDMQDQELPEEQRKELLKVAYKLRFQVLCVQNNIPGFDKTDYPDKLEYDKYDEHSIHILLRHRLTNNYIGTARLIRPADPLNSEDRLPTELHTNFCPEKFVLNSLSRPYTAEISRFTITRDFFKRKGENGMLPTAADFANKASERRRFPHPMLGLVVGIIHTATRMILST